MMLAFGEPCYEVLCDTGDPEYNHELYDTHQPGARPVLRPDLQSEVLGLNHICRVSVCCLWRMTKCSNLTPSLLLLTQGILGRSN